STARGLDRRDDGACFGLLVAIVDAHGVTAMGSEPRRRGADAAVRARDNDDLALHYRLDEDRSAAQRRDVRDRLAPQKLPAAVLADVLIVVVAEERELRRVVFARRDVEPFDDARRTI